MGTMQADTLAWLKRGKKEKATHLIVVCDTFEHDDYPVFVKAGQNVREVYTEYSSNNMQRVMEVYAIHADWDQQLKTGRVLNFDPPPLRVPVAKPKSKKRVTKPRTQSKLTKAFLADIQKAMKKQAVTRAELATRLGCSRAHVTQLLKGNSDMTTLSMVQLADALGLAVVVTVKKARR